MPSYFDIPFRKRVTSRTIAWASITSLFFFAITLRKIRRTTWHLASNFNMEKNLMLTPLTNSTCQKFGKTGIKSTIPQLFFWLGPLLPMTSSPSALIHAEIVTFECLWINMVPNLRIQGAYFACTSVSCDWRAVETFCHNAFVWM